MERFYAGEMSDGRRGEERKWKGGHCDVTGDMPSLSLFLALARSPRPTEQ